MALIKSISGIRGTIGGVQGENLTPLDVVRYTSAFAQILKSHTDRPSMVVGRDGRISGPMIEDIVVQTLVMMGIDVLRLGWTTTPTAEMAIINKNATGGIMITASHNPKNWNALKLFNSRGEFISAATGASVLQIAENNDLDFAGIEQLGTMQDYLEAADDHVSDLLKLELIQEDKIRKMNFKVVVDCINSTGAIILPLFLNELGCQTITINDSIDGQFAHNPEPLESNLKDLSAAVIAEGADLGIAVDPDVDRLAFVDHKGRYCGEEYTLVMVADWVLRNQPGPTVSNLSSSKALKDVTEKYNQPYFASAVGEVNVVACMKEHGATIGGEGNGGIIYPSLHFGRDALVGIGLLLSALAEDQISLEKYRERFPNYVIVKNKVSMRDGVNLENLFDQVQDQLPRLSMDRTDGLKIHFDHGWVHMRESNTEPIVRLYAEGRTIKEAADYSLQIEKILETYL